MSQGLFYIIAAPSGAGKTSLVRALIKQVDNLVISVSHTTRPARPGEVDGINYHFIDTTQFQHLLQQQIFLEHACVFGHYYGTSRAWVMQQLAAGKDVILEIDWQGAQQIRAQFEEVVSIFILPPSLETLRQRLEERGQDSEHVIEQRMQQAHQEILHYSEFDYLLINDDFNAAVQDLHTIVMAQRLRQSFQQQRYQQLLQTLLQEYPC